MGRLLSKDIFLLIAGLFMLAYVVVRASELSFTHDESVSYFTIMGSPEYLKTANNHLLNTWLSRCSVMLFGTSEIALRLPNILAFIAYLAGAYFIVRPSKDLFLYLLAVAGLLLNPFLIDFFSLCRGYGLAMGLMMLSLLFLLNRSAGELNGSRFFRNLVLSLSFAGLAVCANLALANYYIALLLLFSLLFLLQVRKGGMGRARWKVVAVLFVAIVPILLAMKRLLFLKAARQLYFGADTLYDSIRSLVEASQYMTEHPPLVLDALTGLFITLLLLGILSIIVKKDFDGNFALIASLLICIVAGAVAEYMLFGARYPFERTALLFIPLYGLFIYHFALHLLAFYTVSRRIYRPVVLCIFTPLLFHFMSGMNLRYTRSWHYDANTKDAMLLIHAMTQDRTVNATMSNNWLFTPSINYYIDSRQIKVNPVKRGGISPDTEFQYKLSDEPVADGFTAMRLYSDTRSGLWFQHSAIPPP